MSISGIVINKNGGKKLANCLGSLKFCDEIILVDAGSTDGSIEMARSAGVKIVKIKSGSYADSRNIGAREAKGEWLLYLDVDERIPHVLKEKILGKITDNNLESTSFKIFRKNFFLGKWLRHGDWWPDPAHRLIQKSSLIKWLGEIHEHPVVKGKTGIIREPLEHFSKDSVSDMVHNSSIFAPIEAKLMLENGHPPVKTYHFIIAMWREFLRRGIMKSGWLDGIVGIILIFYQMYHQFLVYSLLRQMQSASSGNGMEGKR